MSRITTSTLEFPYSRTLGPVVGAFLAGLREHTLRGVRTPAGTVLLLTYAETISAVSSMKLLPAELSLSEAIFLPALLRKRRHQPDDAHLGFLHPGLANGRAATTKGRRCTTNPFTVYTSCTQEEIGFAKNKRKQTSCETSS